VRTPTIATLLMVNFLFNRYEKDVSEILESVKGATGHQTVLLSATLTPGVERLAGLTLNNPVRVDVVDVAPSTVPVEVEDTAQEALVLPGALTHRYIVTPAKLRLVTLTAFIMDKCLVRWNKVVEIFAQIIIIFMHYNCIVNICRYA